MNWYKCNFIPEWARIAPNGDMSVLSQTISTNKFSKKMGRYIEHLERFEAQFGRDNILVIDFEDIKNNIDKVWSELCHFLDISSKEMSQISDEKKEKKLHLNVGPSSIYYQPSDQELVQMASYYKPWNERLFKWLGKDLGWLQVWYYTGDKS
ncbi:sulfotransferase [Reticulomyxa filosa]|uniref:Sulfotransferase n=1 Tax=Reticulomyxa filosa TaxID=46433 RepID=X6MRG3_RETFI|nr:sulfotransferase [Reticulomyxa filosa]|eukprot:ETO16608.1 sulfotransferase [Reticulomyxa filosa]